MGNTNDDGQYQRRWATPTTVGNTNEDGQYQRRWATPTTMGNTNDDGQYQRRWAIPTTIGNTNDDGQYQRPPLAVSRNPAFFFSALHPARDFSQKKLGFCVYSIIWLISCCAMLFFFETRKLRQLDVRLKWEPGGRYPADIPPISR